MSNEILKTLLNIRSLRAFARDYMDLDSLESAHEKLTTVLEETRDAERIERERFEEKRAKLEKYRKMLEDDGIDIAEIVGAAPSNKQKKERKKKPPKYEYLTESGEVKYWTGQGRTPKAIQAELDNGKTLDDFLISKES